MLSELWRSAVLGFLHHAIGKNIAPKEKPRSNSKLHLRCENLHGGFANAIPQQDIVGSVIQAEYVPRLTISGGTRTRVV
jgi:hypothetical protein